MDVIAIAGLVFSGLAVIVSVRSARRSHATAEEQTLIQRRLLRLETLREDERQDVARRASLAAEIVRRGRDYKLVIPNHGQHKATNVVVTIDGQPVLEHDLVPRGLPEIREVPAGGTIGYVLAPDSGSPAAVQVSIAWEDGTGEPRTWASPLSVYG